MPAKISSSKLLRRRAALLGSVATLSMGLASAAQAQAQDAVYAREGQTLGDVELSTGGRLILDISRVDPQTGALNLGANGASPPVISGTLDADAAANSLWLIATQSQTRRLVNPTVTLNGANAGFEDGIVYEAFGQDTLLTLVDPLRPNGDPSARLTTVRLAGNGTINVATDIETGNSTAIKVEQDTTAALLGEDFGRLNVIVSQSVRGTDMSAYSEGGTRALVDVTNAESLTFDGPDAAIDIRDGVAILASDQHVTIGRQTVMRALDSNNDSAAGTQKATFIHMTGSGTVENFGTLIENGQAGETGANLNRRSQGVVLAGGGTLQNGRTSANDFGRIDMHGAAVVVSGYETGTIVNDGLLRSRSGSAILTTDLQGWAVVRNNVQGTIAGIGTAYEGGEAKDFVVNAGTITGDVDLGENDDAFLAAVDANGNPTGQVNGTIDGGDGLSDAYGRSLSTSGTYTASNAILDGSGAVVNFERHGIEANGSNVVAAFAAAGTLSNGLSMFGTGSIINRANIHTQSGHVGIVARDFASGIDFTNDTGAMVTAEEQSAFHAGGGALSSFTNHGSLVTNGANIAAILQLTLADDFTFDFINSGQIVSTGDTALLVSVDGVSDAGAHLRLTNSGTLSGAGNGVYANSTEGRIEFLNSGLVDGGLFGGSVSGERVIVENSGEIRSAGVNGGGLVANSVDVEVTNNGRIAAALGGASGSLSAALAIRQSTGGTAHVVNGANGVIEASSPNSVAVAASGLNSEVTIENSGRIIGSGTDSAIAGVAGGISLSGVTTAASAIQTANTIDTIINSGEGLIAGNVDLADEDDRFEARGSSVLQGDLRMGDGNDTLLLAGGTVAGMMRGGAGADTLLINLDEDRSIDGSRLSSFETILRDGTGTGILTARGAFDVNTLNLDGMTLRVAADTHLSTQGDITLTGSDRAERLIVEGTIDGAVSLGGGNDRVELNGGTVGEISLGDGDDVVDFSNGGTVLGSVFGGAGNDTIAFRLTADAGTDAVPAAIGFESLDVRGAHKLTLDQAFDTVTLREGADLLVTAGAGTIGNIVGDATDQDVTIEGQLTGGVSLGGGNDKLALMNVSGSIPDALDGGDGIDSLLLNLTGATEFSNGTRGFETITVTGASPLTVGGIFEAGQTLNFGDDDNQLELASGSTFAGTADGAGGTDTLLVHANGSDTTTVSGSILNFEIMRATGGGTAALTGASYAFDTVSIDDGGSLALGSGTIVTADVTFTGAFDNNRIILGAGSVINGQVDGGAGDFDTIAFSQNEGQSSWLSQAHLANYVNFEKLAITGAGEFNIDQDLAGYDVGMEGGKLVVHHGVTLDGNVGSGTLTADDSVAVYGTIHGNVALFNGNDTVENAGRIEGDVLLGAGDDRYIARDGGVVTGTIDGGSGDNTFIFRLGGIEGSIPGNVINFNSFGVFGPGTLDLALNAGQDYARIELMEGANLTLADHGGSVGTIIGDDSAQVVTIGTALTGGVSLGGGNDTLNLMLSGTLSGALDGGENADHSADNDILNITLAGTSAINGATNFETINVSGTDELTIGGTFGNDQLLTFTGSDDNRLVIAAGAIFGGTVDGGAGNDLLTVVTGAPDSRTIVSSQIRGFELLSAEGGGTLALTGSTYHFDSVQVLGGNLALGAGTALDAGTGVSFDGAYDNRLTLLSGAVLTGGADGGAGDDDVLELVQGAGTTRLLSAVGATNFERLITSGAGELRIDQDAAFTGGVSVDGGLTTVTAGSTLTANVAGGANADTFAALGFVDGNVDLGGGDDRLVIGSLASITGIRAGGAGTDTLELRTAGTTASPTSFDGTGFDSFENLAVGSGAVRLTASTSWNDVNVLGGSLFAAAGTTLTSAETIDVAAGATFGSGGTVNADIAVRGTLSPGTPLGTMVVNGDVTMMPGSNLLIELSAANGKDLLDVNGTLTIENGAAIDITGVLDNMPGDLLDIVTADAITGRFTTINKSSSVFGFVVQNGNRIQIRGEFSNDEAYPGNVQASVDYANQVLGAGYGVQAFTNALNVLTAADGTIDQHAFAQLTPEAYGSAAELGLETALTMVDSARALKLSASVRDGLYSFAQALTGKSELDGKHNSGAARTQFSNQGYYGGVGYGAAGGRLNVGAFVGKLDTRATMSQLGAKAEADGWAAGLYADAAIGAAGIHGLVAYADTDANMTRGILAAQGSALGNFGLKSWVADFSLDYRIDAGAVKIIPTAGLSYVGTRRSAVTETGAGDFSLDVDGQKRSQWFGDLAVAVSGDFSLGGFGLRPYAELGVRRMLNNNDARVAGIFEGAPGDPIVVSGVERDRTAARFSLGAGLDLSKALTVEFGYRGELGHEDRSGFMGRATLRF